MRLHYFDNFRAIAIVLIIFGHSYGAWAIDTPVEVTLSNVITGGTALFVFISGFFLHAVFYRRFHFARFLKKKFLAVALPYLILSCAFMGLFLGLTGDLPTRSLYPEAGLAELFAINLVTGRHLVAYWYIPYILLTFLASPLILPFIGLGKRAQAGVVIGLFALSCVVQRPDLDLDPVHAFVYFLPFYLLGAFYSLHRDEVDRVLARRLALVVAAWLLALAAMTVAGQVGNATKPAIWGWAGIDLMVVQKICLIALLLAVLRRGGDRPNAVLRFVAEISFPLFFFHPWVLFGFAQAGLLERYPGNALEFLGFATLVFGLSVVVSVLARRLLGGVSRYVIGA